MRPARADGGHQGRHTAAAAFARLACCSSEIFRCLAEAAAAASPCWIKPEILPLAHCKKICRKNTIILWVIFFCEFVVKWADETYRLFTNYIVKFWKDKYLHEVKQKNAESALGLFYAS